MLSHVGVVASTQVHYRCVLSLLAEGVDVSRLANTDYG